MLQIISGKFFHTDELYRTQHRSVLYSNARLFDDVETCVGSLRRADVDRGTQTFVYEVEERLEAVSRTGEREVLVSIGASALASDFAAIAAFVWRAMCSPDLAVVSRLTRLGTTDGTTRPGQYVQRVFDPVVLINPEEASELAEFLAQLIGLRRAHYTQVMRAIRRYNFGMQRIGDDLPLAYLLLVASVESLAQAFDRFEPEWADLEDRKRRIIDEALADASDEIRAAIRTAILRIEHVALGRRYREFVLSHLPRRFFREDAKGIAGPASRRDLSSALARAYALRSQLVHRVSELPRPLTLTPSRHDTMLIEGSPVLTFNGLARIAREVILQVVRNGEQVEAEKLDYREELPNVLRARVAPRYWVWRSDRLTHRTARRYLSGFLNELSSVLRADDGGGLTDIRDVLGRVEALAPGLAAHQRAPLLVLYYLFHWHIAPEWHRPNWEEFLRHYMPEFDRSSPETLLAHVITDASLDWDQQTHDDAIETYFTERFRTSGLHVDPLFETAMLVHAAKTRFAAGDPNSGANYLRDAVEHDPGNMMLQELEIRVMAGEIVSTDALSWRRVLLPKQNDNAGSGNDA